MPEHPTQCLHEERWEHILSELENSSLLIRDIHHKLFIGNGREAMIPSLDKRITRLEDGLIPRDDMRDVLQAYRVGRYLISGIALVAAVGFLGILFWSLFQRRLP